MPRDGQHPLHFQGFIRALQPVVLGRRRAAQAVAAAAEHRGAAAAAAGLALSLLGRRGVRVAHERVLWPMRPRGVAETPRLEPRWVGVEVHARRVAPSICGAGQAHTEASGGACRGGRGRHQGLLPLVVGGEQRERERVSEREGEGVYVVVHSAPTNTK